MAHVSIKLAFPTFLRPLKFSSICTFFFALGVNLRLRLGMLKVDYT